MKTEFKLIEGFPGYRVSKTGIVESCLVRRGLGRGRGTEVVQGDKWRPLKQYIEPSGYPVVSLGLGNRTTVARIVLKTLTRQSTKGEECRHLDGNKLNSNLSNLAWGSSRDNTADQKAIGTLIGGERHGMAKLTNAQVDEIRKLEGRLTQQKIADMFGVSQCHISDILNGNRRKIS